LLTTLSPPLHRRVIVVTDPSCLRAAEAGGRLITRESIKWLLAGVAMLSILALVARRRRSAGRYR
jgi:LPXTG-motif cell wall-anchored protein